MMETQIYHQKTSSYFRYTYHYMYNICKHEHCAYYFLDIF
jgi:hypothetical protein